MVTWKRCWKHSLGLRYTWMVYWPIKVKEHLQLQQEESLSWVRPTQSDFRSSQSTSRISKKCRRSVIHSEQLNCYNNQRQTRLLSNKIEKSLRFCRIFPGFFPHIFLAPFSSRIIHLACYEYLGATTDCGRNVTAHMLPTNIRLFTRGPPTWNWLLHHLHLLFSSCVWIVLISPVSSQCPATLLSLWSSQTEPGNGRLAALLPNSTCINGSEPMQNDQAYFFSDIFFNFIIL